MRQTQCRITNVVGAEHAMLPLNVKSRKWPQSPLLGYQVHISNQLDDLTSTLADFLFHPEGFSYYWYKNCVHVQFFGLLTVSIQTMFSNICCVQKACKSYNFAAYKVSFFFMRNEIFESCTAFTCIQWNI